MNGLVLELKYGAKNYKPLPVILSRGAGVYCWDEKGKQYLDMMGAYSALGHGHCHPKLLAALVKQAECLSLTSRAFYNDKLGYFLEKACTMTGFEAALPMNTGSEAVETAIKAARKWGYTQKKIPQDKAEIIVCQDNFHGRTTTIISMSTEKQYQDGFGPLTPGFRVIPYDDTAALAKAITPNTAAFLFEPIQGEAGIRMPSLGYLKEVRALCQAEKVLMIADEVQTGLGRTGELLACDHEDVHPDCLLLGKSLGGGLIPVSLFLASEEVMQVFTPGDHGSTFGGNPLASVVGLEALKVIEEEHLVDNARAMGAYFMSRLKELSAPFIKEIRGKGLFIGIEIDPKHISARRLCLALLEEGLLTKDTHDTVLRLAPPLIIKKEQIDEGVEKIKTVFSKQT